jgi:hypothetical protein
LGYIGNLAALDQITGNALARWGLQYRNDPANSNATDLPDPSITTDLEVPRAHKKPL